MLQRILRGKNYKGFGHFVLCAVISNLSFFHYFKQGGLCFCGRAVDFVNQYNAAEYRTLLKGKHRIFRMKNCCADNIARH